MVSDAVLLPLNAELFVYAQAADGTSHGWMSDDALMLMCAWQNSTR